MCNIIKMNKLTIEKVSKEIKGTKILDDINISMESGKIYGLVGKNGSGKTMLIRTISGLLKPTEGLIKYNNNILYKDIDFIPDIGIVIENISLYKEFTGKKNLELLAKIRKKCSKSEIETALQRVGLDPTDKRIVKKYSLGMRQRLTLAQAIMEKPNVLLLDEPTNALDSDGVELIRTICLEELKRGAIVLIASHNKDDINKLCNIKFAMNNGKLEVLDQ